MATKKKTDATNTQVKAVEPVEEVKAEPVKTTAKATAKKTAPKETVVETLDKPVKKAAAKSTATKTATTAKSTVKKTATKVKSEAKAEEVKAVSDDIQNADKAQEVQKESKKVVNAVPYKKKVLFATSEAGPFIRSGGLGDVAAALPQALNDLGADCRVILPLYHDIPADFRSTMKYIGSVYVTLAWRYQYAGLFSAVYNGVTYYFVDNEYYFKRQGIYGHYDDAERFAFFSKAVLECIRLMDFYPEVIHSNDWHTALVPLFLDTFYRGIEEYKFIKTVFTIHNIEFQGKYGLNIIKDILGLPESATKLIEYADCVNFMKGAIECSNAVTTVSPSYAGEIMDKYYSYGLDMILKSRSFKLSGIVNGIDTKLYDPLTDKSLFKNFDYDTIENKKVNKEGLLDMLDMNMGGERPLIGMVTRLTKQKGLDLIMAVLDKILECDCQLVILGKGDWKYENALKEYEYRYPKKIKVIINFSTDIANKIYGGADLFLMPSKFEPCGLSQMIAMRYGTIPIVRQTGGLRDTVIGFNPLELTGNGFNFYSYNAYDMLDAIHRALGTYNNKREWNALVANAMNTDFTWKTSAEKYLELYNKL